MKKWLYLFSLVMMSSVLMAQQETIIIKKNNSENESEEILEVEVDEDADGETSITINGEKVDLSALEDLELNLEDASYKIEIITEKIGEEMEAVLAALEDEMVDIEKIIEEEVFVHDKKPRLGVMIENAGGNGAMITEVWPNSGAEAAGLKEGDIIMKVGKEKVSDIQGLIDALQEFKEGDQVKLTVLRAGETEKFKVEMRNVERPRKTCHDRQVRVKKMIRKENPPMETPAVDLYQLDLNYSGDNDELVVEFNAKNVPTDVRVESAAGEVLYQKSIADFDGHFMDRISLTEEQKRGARLIISQEGSEIEHSFD